VGLCGALKLKWQEASRCVQAHFTLGMVASVHLQRMVGNANSIQERPPMEPRKCDFFQVMTDDLSNSQPSESCLPNQNRGVTSLENAHRRICYSHLAHPFDAAALDGLEPLDCFIRTALGFLLPHMQSRTHHISVHVVTLS